MHKGHIQISGKRINARRAIAEALSCDLADVDYYQYGKYDDVINRQVYQAGGDVYAVLPVSRNTPDGWNIIAEVSNDTSSVVVLRREESIAYERRSAVVGSVDVWQTAVTTYHATFGMTEQQFRALLHWLEVNNYTPSPDRIKAWRHQQGI